MKRGRGIVQSAEQGWIAAACRWLGFSTSADVPEGLITSLKSASGEELETLLNVVSANFDQLTSGALRLRQLMQQVAVRLNLLLREATPEVAIIAPEILMRLCDMLSTVDPIASAHCLQMLAMQPDEESIDALAATLTVQPPEQLQAVAIALSPLWQLESGLLELFFDRLGDGFLHPATMSALLDLANYSNRTGRLEEHPYAERVEELLSLLNSLTQRLSLMEENPAKFGDDVESIQKVLGESVALTVSLCDALGLIGDPRATENLRKTLALSHRRVQTEAAGALARLNDAAGKQRLIELAEDRVARMRAVTYAEELGFAEEIEGELRLPQAMAEAELASWLASGDRFGIAPHSMELFDTRTQYWPSFEEPRDCYLFRYTYILPSGQLSNIGIAGPLTCAFNSDLANLPPDDIYAVFAGWQAEHEDIFEVPEALLNREQRRETDRLIRSLQERECEVKQVLALTFFLGELALLATIEHDGKRLHAVTDGNELLCYPASDHPTALTPDLVLAIYRGRKLLRTFNH
ncbi:MAG: HEAT repeat domain-containing protein [Pirellulaceae bacterium]|nr:HEAT repeat domain-containing protein [Pirellulaceae bacterium]